MRTSVQGCPGEKPPRPLRFRWRGGRGVSSTQMCVLTPPRPDSAVSLRRTASHRACGRQSCRRGARSARPRRAVVAHGPDVDAFRCAIALRRRRFPVRKASPASPWASRLRATFEPYSSRGRACRRDRDSAFAHCGYSPREASPASPRASRPLARFEPLAAGVASARMMAGARD